MRVPLSWLRDFTPVEGTPPEIARALSFLGLVVEGTEKVAAPLAGIVVARVLATKPHPAADRIQIVDVDPGDGGPLQICCGAFNMAPGDLVPLATLGTVMPSGAEIGRRKMRGEWSNGMLCSAPELGLGAEGHVPAILVLAAGSGAPGEPVAEVLGFGDDVVFDIEISPNRSDCFSMVGVARDLAAGMRLPFSVPRPPRSVAEGARRAEVEVLEEASGLCPRFTGTVIESVDAASVAPLVQRRLSLAGMRPINPVVDVSNYVMLELGQPNHPYDLDRLGGGGLAVRRALQGEVLVTLDGQERNLCPDDCVIADATGTGVGVGGIMGGALAEIAGTTSTVLLEMANFDPRTVAATGKRLGLLSEARTRFERGVDISLPDIAIDRFVQLLGPNVRRGQTTDLRASSPSQPTITVRTDRVNLVLGTSLAPEQCAELLAPLGFAPISGGGSDLEVTVPTWRPDCEREVDLIEEIARVHGYDNIARELPSRPAGATGLTVQQKARRRVQQLLLGAGASEAWTMSFLSAAEINRSGLDAAAAVELENPLDQSQGLLRTSVLPGLLRAAQFNFERQAGAVNLFETGSVFCRAFPGQEPGPVPGVVEWQQLGVVAAGDGADVAHAVAVWEVLATGLRLCDASIGPLGPSRAGTDSSPACERSALSAAGTLHPGRRGAVSVGGLPVGVVGELAPELGARYDLPGRVAVLLVDLTGLLDGYGPSWVARTVSRFPATDLDMAFVVADEVPAGAVGRTVREVAGDLVESVALFDVWRDTSLGGGRRSLAFRARLRAPDRTLTEQEVAAVRTAVALSALERHGAELRGFEPRAALD
jgi:phenylalanyl-tRNA synthetase beta chain